MRKAPRQAVENFAALVLKMATSDDTRPLSPGRKSLIEKRVFDFFSDFHIPNHPPYAAMIHRAIQELKQSSTEESISEFIRKEYADLPWAHCTLLKRHLQKLCENGELVFTTHNSYLLVDESDNTTGPPVMEQINGRKRLREKKEVTSKIESKQPVELPSLEREHKLKRQKMQEKPLRRQLRPRPSNPDKFVDLEQNLEEESNQLEGERVVLNSRLKQIIYRNKGRGRKFAKI